MEEKEEPPQTLDDGRILICDTCKKPIRRFDAVYSVAFNEEAGTGRHWDCHTPIEEIFEGLRGTIKKAEDQLKILRKHMK